MAINPLYVIAPSLEMYFVDKDTGAPLAGGQVFFYSDVNRTTPKPVYEITGPPDYTYTALPNPVTLSAVGTFQDASGANVLPYYFPYTSGGAVELYYIQVYDSNGVFQFDRQAWPNIAASSVNPATTNYLNLIPNGQFLIHNNNLPTLTGQIAAATTAIAPGGWYFIRPSMTTSTDFVTFPLSPQPPVSPPSGNPRFSVNVTCSSPNMSDNQKDLTVQFSNVNKFGSATQQYTFACDAISNGGSSVTATLYLIKNFGTGGSAQTQTPLQTFTIGTSNTQLLVSFVFGLNTGKTIGANNDDNVQLAIRFPNSLFNVTLNDFILTIGQVAFTDSTMFVDETDSDMIVRSVFGSLPILDPNGQDNYLPVRITPFGVFPDHTEVGKIYAKATPAVEIGELAGNGSSYMITAFSSDNIPYSRLGKKLFITGNGLNIYQWGGGYGYVNAIPNTTLANSFLFSFNTTGSMTSIADGATSTGFTYTSMTTGNNYNVYSYLQLGSIYALDVQGAFPGSTNPVSAGTGPGFVAIQINGGGGVSTGYNSFAEFQLTINTAPTSALASTWFGFSSINAAGSSAVTNYYVWFTWNGTGTDPAPFAGTGIKVALLSAYITSIADLLQAISVALNGYQSSIVSNIPVGSSITAGSYFTYTAPVSTDPFVGWYTVNGAGTAPVVTGNLFSIPVLTTMTSAQVVEITRQYINMQAYGTPDLRGEFLRGYDPTQIFDAHSNRGTLSQNQFLFASPTFNFIGSYERCAVESHNHALATFAIFSTSTGPLPDDGESYGIGASVTAFTGVAETRPFNVDINYIIKY